MAHEMQTTGLQLHRHVYNQHPEIHQELAEPHRFHPRIALRERADPKSPMPFQDSISGLPDVPLILSRRPSSKCSLHSHPVQSKTLTPSEGQVRHCKEFQGPNTPISINQELGDSARGPKDGTRHIPVSSEHDDAGKWAHETIQHVDSEFNTLKKGSQSSEGSTASEGVGEVAKEDDWEGSGDRVKYKTMSWFQAGIVMIAETISLGILSLPHALASLGIVPGVLLIFFLGLLTTYTGYVLFQVKMAHPKKVESFADAIALMLGTPGRFLGEALQALLLIFIMAAHVLTFSVMMNVLTGHALCTVVFTVIGAAVCFLATLPRTMRTNALLSVFSCISIAAATIIAMIGIGLDGPGHGDSFLVTPANLTNLEMGSMAVSNMILAYNGHIAYPTIISEMREPKDFPKALALLQTTTITFYTVVAVVIYYYAGQKVGSPALNSASPIIRKIAYGIATPTIIVAGVIAGLVAAKVIYSHVWRKKPEVKEERTMRARASWYLVVGILWIVAWLIASAIPVFNQLLALIGAAFGSWFCMGFLSMFWLCMNWRGSLVKSYLADWKKAALFCFNVVIFAMGAIICVLGMYGSIKAIARNGSDRAPFSCSNNVSY